PDSSLELVRAGGSSRPANRQRVSSLTCHSRFFVLVFHLLACTSFQRDQGQPDVVLVDPEDHRLLFAIIVLKADGQKMLAFFGEHEQWRKHRRGKITPVHLLPVFEKIDPLVRNLHLDMFRKKDEVGRIRDLYIAGAIAGDIGPRPTYVLGPAAITPGRDHKSRQTQT